MENYIFLIDSGEFTNFTMRGMIASREIEEGEYSEKEVADFIESSKKENTPEGKRSQLFRTFFDSISLL